MTKPKKQCFVNCGQLVKFNKLYYFCLHFENLNISLEENLEFQKLTCYWFRARKNDLKHITEWALIKFTDLYCYIPSIWLTPWPEIFYYL